MAKTKRLVGSVILLLLHSSVPCLAEPESTLVSFDNTCQSAVKMQIDLAVTQMHSFEYLEAARRFDEIIEQDPDPGSGMTELAI